MNFEQAFKKFLSEYKEPGNCSLLELRKVFFAGWEACQGATLAYENDQTFPPSLPSRRRRFRKFPYK